MTATHARAIALEDDSAAWRVVLPARRSADSPRSDPETALEAYNPASVPFRHRRTDDR